jgi:hypothetical protein
MSDPQNTPLTFQEYLDGIEELKRTKGWIVAREIERIGRSYYIFKANYDELAESIWQIKLPINLPLWGDDSVKEMDQFLNEVTRQLHNFVAAAKSLVDHTRIVAREMYKGTELLNEIESEIAYRFVQNPLVHFVHKLRDYILHRNLPLVSAKLTSVLNASLLINIKELRDWNGWNEPSRKFIKSSNDEEKIEGIVNAYFDAIFAFHDWFHKRQLEFHKENFMEAERLRQRLVNSSWHIK